MKNHRLLKLFGIFVVLTLAVLAVPALPASPALAAQSLYRLRMDLEAAAGLDHRKIIIPDRHIIVNIALSKQL